MKNKTVREVINEAETKGYDVVIEDAGENWEHIGTNQGWREILDHWLEEEDAFDHRIIKEVTVSTEDSFVFITLEE